MNSNELQDTYGRFNKVLTEIKFRERERRKEAESAAKILSRISKEDVEILKGILPDIETVVTFTAEQLYNNSNQEVQQVQRLFNSIIEQANQALDSLEDAL